METSSGPNPPAQAFVKQGNNNFINATIVLRNTGTADTSGLNIVVTVTDGISSTGHTPPSGWTTTYLNSTQVQFTAPPSGQVSALTGQQTITFQIRRSGSAASPSVRVDIYPGNGLQGLVSGVAT